MIPTLASGWNEKRPQSGFCRPKSSFFGKYDLKNKKKSEDQFLNSSTETQNDLIFEIPATGIECLKSIGEYIYGKFKSFEQHLTGWNIVFQVTWNDVFFLRIYELCDLWHIEFQPKAFRTLFGIKIRLWSLHMGWNDVKTHRNISRYLIIAGLKWKELWVVRGPINSTKIYILKDFLSFKDF